MDRRSLDWMGGRRMASFLDGHEHYVGQFRMVDANATASTTLSRCISLGGDMRSNGSYPILGRIDAGSYGGTWTANRVTLKIGNCHFYLLTDETIREVDARCVVTIDGGNVVSVETLDHDEEEEGR